MRRTLGLILGLALGAALSQFPEFSQQYAQRLGGAVDELNIITTRFDTAAARQNLSREDAFARYETSLDPFLVEQGRDARTTFARHTRLSAHLQALETAGPIEEIVHFTQFYDAQIGARTWQAYQPAVPLTPQGLIFAGLGLVSGYGLVGLGALMFRRRRPAKA